MGLVTTTNINTVTVRDAIGESVTAVAALCDSGKVNMFSKYKPISSNKVVGLEEADYAAASYGLVIPSLSNPKNTSGTNWAYNRPGSYGRRLGDFRNYYHDAPIPLKQVKGTAIAINRFTGGSHNIPFSIVQAPSGYEGYVLNVSNLTPLGGDGVLLNNYYLACGIYNSGGALVGTYYSYEKIKYSSGVGADMNGASIALSSGSYLKSNDAPIENYQAGNYTIYLYICNQDNGSYINPRMYWPIYHTASNPTVISLSILSLSGTVEIHTHGIRPTGGLWFDNDDSFCTGEISAEKRGPFSDFHAKFSFTNLTGSTLYIPSNKPFLFYNYITAWGGTVSRRYSALNYGSNDIIIAPYATVDDIIFYISPLPSSVPTVSGGLGLDLHLHYGNNDSGEYFEPVSPVIALNYVE